MKTALITGATSGIGTATARALAHMGFLSILTGRSEGRGMELQRELRAGGQDANYHRLDLASLASVEQSAKALAKRYPRIDLVVANAGVGVGNGLTADGFEVHLGVNHLGHFALIGQLEPVLAPVPRIVVVSSEVHRRASDLSFDRFRRRSRIPFVIESYARSKVSNILFASELARRRPSWQVCSVHPGLTLTGIIPPYVRPFVRNRLLMPEQGADTVVWSSTTNLVENRSGGYFARRTEIEPSELATDMTLARELWDRSQGWTAAWKA